MKKTDFLWIFIFIIFTLFIIIPSTRSVYENLNSNYPYALGFLKTMVLASMGERLVSRIKYGSYFRRDGFVLKAFVWGLLGMTFVLIFPIFFEGVQIAQLNGFLPRLTHVMSNRLLTAFLTSLLMNLVFAPTFMLIHRVTDQYIEKAEGRLRNIKDVRLNDVLDAIDFNVFFKFTLLKTIPFFWIPAHTITFILPGSYRVLFAAYLSLALGLLLSMKKKSNHITILTKGEA